MTRVEKNKKLRNKNLLKIYLLTIVYFIVGILAIICLIFNGINNIIIKLFNKLSKPLKTITIYTLIILSVLYLINPSVNTKVNVNLQDIKDNVKTSIKEVNNTKVDVIKENIENIEIQEQIKTIDLGNENANNIYNKAIENGLTKEQSILLVSISRHETGNWTSKAFNEKNNFGGIMCNGATEIKRYSTYEEGLQDFIRILNTYYFNMGLNEIAEIGAKYCPVGAKNDPNGLNKYWVGGVTEFYNYYLQLV